MRCEAQFWSHYNQWGFILSRIRTQLSLLSFFLKLVYFFFNPFVWLYLFQRLCQRDEFKRLKEKIEKGPVLAHFSILQSYMVKYLRRDFWNVPGHELASYIANRTWNKENSWETGDLDIDLTKLGISFKNSTCVCCSPLHYIAETEKSTKFYKLIKNLKISCLNNHSLKKFATL